MGKERRYANFYSNTKCFCQVTIDGTIYACGGTLEMAFNLNKGQVDYVWCPRCGHIHYEHEDYSK